jgi:hypothetical protein
MDPRLTIIRLAFAFIASLVLYWLAPWWSWVPLALMMPPLTPADCGKCTGGTCHVTMDVVFTGIVNGTCTDCTNFNATWEVTGTCVTSGGICLWQFDFVSAICSKDYVRVVIQAGFPPTDIYLNPTLGGTDVASWRVLESSTSGPVDCGFSSRVAAWLGGGAGECDYTASTATVTAT